MGQFSASIDKWVKAAGGSIEKAIRSIAWEMFSEIIMASPVDTGRFKGNWRVAIGSIPTGTIEFDDKAGTVTLAAAKAQVMQLRAGDIITMANNVPYAVELEHGHSRQAPDGVVWPVLLRFSKGIAPIGQSVGGESSWEGVGLPSGDE